jgi:protein-L-isoaspartate(D-aspartate) O-methyltransferase
MQAGVDVLYCLLERHKPLNLSHLVVSEDNAVDIEQARFNMIEQQIRPAEVLDQRVVDVILNTPREDFVPENYKNLAFADTNIPLGHDQALMTPILEAKLLQALNVQPADIVLEIGTGSGYLTALLAKLAKQVQSVEIYEDLSTQAAAKLEKHGINNVTLEVGDAASGWGDDAAYDVIAITGSLPVLPESFKRSLKVGGRLFAIVGDNPVMESKLIVRINEDEWSEECLQETDIATLINAQQPQRFVF